MLLAAGTYVLLRRRGEESFVEQPDDSAGDDVPTGGGVATAIKPKTVTWHQRATLAALVVLVVGALAFDRQVISYTCVIVALGPIAAWAVLVLPGSF
jgi:hypothetical protein